MCGATVHVFRGFRTLSGPRLLGSDLYRTIDVPRPGTQKSFPVILNLQSFIPDGLDSCCNHNGELRQRSWGSTKTLNRDLEPELCSPRKDAKQGFEVLQALGQGRLCCLDLCLPAAEGAPGLLESTPLEEPSAFKAVKA